MALSDYQTSYEISPIILVGGIAGTGMIPIVSLLSSSMYSAGITSAPSTGTTDSDYFGKFTVLSGGTLVENEIGTYPFANMTVAANAVIANPLHISLEMSAPASATFDVEIKKSIFTALKSTLDQHTAMGGYYSVSTPSYIYPNCLLTSLVDATQWNDGQQVQTQWIWNFMQPLLTNEQAAAAQNLAMNKITKQTANAGNPPGSQPLVTSISNPAANIVQGYVPATSNLAGASIAPSTNASTPSLSSVSPFTPSWAQ